MEDAGGTKIILRCWLTVFLPAVNNFAAGSPLFPLHYPSASLEMNPTPLEILFDSTAILARYQRMRFVKNNLSFPQP